MIINYGIGETSQPNNSQNVLAQDGNSANIIDGEYEIISSPITATEWNLALDYNPPQIEDIIQELPQTIPFKPCYPQSIENVATSHDNDFHNCPIRIDGLYRLSRMPNSMRKCIFCGCANAIEGDLPLLDFFIK